MIQALAKLYHLNGQFINLLAPLSFLFVSVLCAFYFYWIQDFPNIFVLVAGLVTLVAASLLALNSSRISITKLDTLNPIKTLYVMLALGLIVRILWMASVPPIQISDFATYIRAADRLVETGSYFFVFDENHSLMAWRPPGYSLFLASCIYIFGASDLIPAISNLIFYALTTLILFGIGKQLANEKVALITAAIYVSWPSNIMITGLAAAEPFSLMLFTGSFLALLHALKGKLWFAIPAGVLIGASALVKPAFMVFPCLWVLYVLMRKRFDGHAAKVVGIATVVTVMTISPWTYRNYLVLDAFVPISTNGGSVFYRANNPLATGSYIQKGERDLDAHIYDEVKWSKLGMQWGIEWIKSDPVGFIKLALRKQAIFLGHDNTGVYWTLDRGHQNSGPTYTFLEVLSNFWWACVIILAACGVFRHRHYFAQNALGGLLIWNALFLVVVHSVFESQARYHGPILGFYAILASLFFVDKSKIKGIEELPKEQSGAT